MQNQRLGQGLSMAAWALLLVVVAVTTATAAQTEPVPAKYQVGIRDVEWTDIGPRGRRILVMTMFYPAHIVEAAATPAVLPMAVDVALYRDSPVAFDGHRYPLVLLSHGRGSNGKVYAWFAQYLASHGYVVAAMNHYRANTYDSSIIYLTTKIWQRPVDLGLAITWLTKRADWGKYIDEERIGVAGHSQGGFTALWIGGARVNAALFASYQRHFVDGPLIPGYLRRQMRVAPAPALHVDDARVKAAFAMAPGSVKGFGMDPDGLRSMKIPTYLIVGEGDTQTPPADNAVFAGKYIPNAEVQVLPGRVDHEIFTNECDQEGRDELPESCIDAPGVDRHQLHALIGAAALKFFDAALKVMRP
jgi:predicted dienelactone hydrolase